LVYRERVICQRIVRSIWRSRLRGRRIRFGVDVPMEPRNNDVWIAGANGVQSATDIGRLSGNPSAACEYLTRLELNWIDIIAKTYDELSRVKWRHS
jgi:hypothetical protein